MMRRRSTQRIFGTAVVHYEAPTAAQVPLLKLSFSQERLQLALESSDGVLNTSVELIVIFAGEDLVDFFLLCLRQFQFVFL